MNNNTGIASLPRDSSSLLCLPSHTSPSFELIYLEFPLCHSSSSCSTSSSADNKNNNQIEMDKSNQEYEGNINDDNSRLNENVSIMKIKLHSSKTDLLVETKKSRRKIHPKTFHMNKYELAYILSQVEKYSPLSSCLCPCKNVRENDNRLKKHHIYIFQVAVSEPIQHYIDHKSNDIVTMFMIEKRELEHSLNWLSTLGGAFSALGENSESFAQRAGKVSKGQLLIAMKLGSPTIMSRCRLYAAISLLQLGKLKTAKQILEREWAYANSLPPDSDPRLKRMCIGIWAKLKYEYYLIKKQKRQSKICNSGGAPPLKGC